ncbi:MAG: FadR/GntR family transcriptional regulator [Burkholderiales bacterium]
MSTPIAARVPARRRALPPAMPDAQDAFAPIRTRRTFEEICQRIREQVGAGVLKPGDKLPAERELAQQFGVGRSALREALRSLEIAGIVRLEKGVKGGAFIRDGDSGRMDELVRDMLALGTVTIESLTEARQHVQELVVRLVCERATAADLAAIEHSIDRLEEFTRAGRFLERVECSREFFHLLAVATRNPMLSMMVASLNEVLMRFVYARIAAGGKPQPRLVEKRRAFLAALRARDVALATDLMRSHLESVHRYLLKDEPRATQPTASRRIARKHPIN